MKISLDWLRDFIDWQGSAEELAARLTAGGLNVEGLAEFVLAFPKVVVARVLEVQPHPQADKLRLCRVHDGAGELSIVCGAPNVRAGLHVLLATPGAELPGGVKIRVSKIRGVESQGMICSARELGLGADAAGIMELPESAEPGTAADEIYGFRDHVLDVEITPNRPDWLSHYGVAREVAALTGSLLGAPAVWTPPKTAGERLDWTVEIENFADCPRYMAHLVRGLKIGPAPVAMQRRLLAVGQRPINNVVDITNYVMLELGQPLHAFDRGKLSGTKLLVKRATPDQSFTTLDGAARALGPEHLVIADSAGPVALAGVMGGARSEVDDQTQEVLLESAFFDPLVVRRSARSLGLVTDSSYRFERESDWAMVEKAAQRALYLLQQHAGARIVTERVDRQNPDRETRPDIPLRMAQVNRLLGTELETSEAAQLLQALDLTVVPLGQARNRKSASANLMVQVPSFRRDLKEEVDLIEEIARVRGYDKIPIAAAFRGGDASRHLPVDRFRGQARRYLAAVGFAECVTSSFLAREDLARLQLPAEDRRCGCLTVRNPRHGGETVLRTMLLPAVLRTVQLNLHAGCPPPLRLFQIHRVFLPAGPGRPAEGKPGEAGLPEEVWTLEVALAGRGDQAAPGVTTGLLELKGVLEALAAEARVPLGLEPGGGEPFLDAGAQWRLTVDGQPVGWAGAVRPEVLRAFEIEEPVVVADLAIESLPLSGPPPVFRDFPRFPAVKRDLSLVVPGNIRFEQVAAVVRREGGVLLESMELFDIYHGKGVPEGAMVLGIRLKFRSPRGNLKGTAVDQSIAQMVAALGRELDVVLRG